MMFIKNILFLMILSFIDGSIYLYYTDDSQSVDFYDCFYHQSIIYCRRPKESIPLQRDNQLWNCYHHGKIHTFHSLLLNNISVNTVLHKWKSGMNEAEKYSQYRESQFKKLNETERYICECTDSSSFGKFCEYKLSTGNLVNDTVTDKRNESSPIRKYGGDILCYKTIECNSGVLCLDWRDICDGLQQCMFGYDEENCDKIEFNECEIDEYRCMNGMCIAEEYFLDGDYDCMDMSDEKERFNDMSCSEALADFNCDDRICPPYQWPCGDGQCIEKRLAYQNDKNLATCNNQRDRFHSCETGINEQYWTLPNGQCYIQGEYNDTNIYNGNISELCTYLLRCHLSLRKHQNCTCEDTLIHDCLSPFRIQYPKNALLAPYIFDYFYISLPHRIISNVSYSGVIKCRGYMGNISKPGLINNCADLRDCENRICNAVLNESTFSTSGYDRFCYNDSKTFNNYSYNFIDICADSNMCISAYRIQDGIKNCLNGQNDESKNDLVSKSCSKVRRHRFRCSADEPSCLYANMLGDYYSHCKNNYDESWMGISILLSNLNCNSKVKDDCHSLRRYIEISWDSNVTLKNYTSKQIPFRAYCDTFLDLSLKEDENITDCQSFWSCPRDHWQCATGQCIPLNWVLDGDWDCSDASDEENLFSIYFNKSHHNYQWLNKSEFQHRFAEKYAKQPFGHVCNLSIEYPCLPINKSHLDNNIRTCINWKYVGDGHVDCLGGYDERNFIKHCDRPTLLGYNFKCLSSNTCIPYSYLCSPGYRCPNPSDDELWCQYFHISDGKFNEFTCQNGTRLGKERCDNKSDCFDSEDEYMCIRDKSSSDIYRKNKQSSNRIQKQKVQLPVYPTNVNISLHTRSKRTTFAEGFIVLPNLLYTPYWCNRGIGVFGSDGSIVCFCPIQYHGDQCQYHSDRITFFFNVNLTQSVYTTSSDISIVIKLLTLFLYDNQVLSSLEFHVRPGKDINSFTKQKAAFHYLRSQQELDAKRKRYFNRSNIITEHPYAIRVEAYEMKIDRKPLRIAVWQYQIYFDYLPVHRLVKVLRLTKPDLSTSNPCRRNPCQPKEECYPLMNDKSKYICLCKANYSGPNCTNFHSLCKDNYCSSTALCQPSYRGLSHGNEYPYCICTVYHIGQRCELIHSACLENPCANGATCFQRTRPNEYYCTCTDKYQGDTCTEEKHSIHLSIDKNHTIAHQGIIVQYFHIDYSDFELTIDHQNVYSNIPDTLFHLHSGKIAPEIILLKTYLYEQMEMYLISLQINTPFIHGLTKLTDKNRCININSRTPNLKDISVIKYHQLCRNNQNLFCFYDLNYLCICENDHYRAECFNYDSRLEDCSHCLANGHCLKGDKTEYLCICPPCRTGRFCQFNFESFSFTLDQLFFDDLLSKNSFTRDLTFYCLILSPCVLFLFGLVNNLFCLQTFRRPRCLRNGTGQYLLFMSIINQLNLTILVLRLIHLTINVSHTSSHSLINDILCKISSFLLTSSTRIAYWFVSLIAIERLYVTMFFNRHWLRKPHIARRLILVTILSTLITEVYECIYIKSQISSDDGKRSMCVLALSVHTSFWKIWHFTITIINALAPFFINLTCTIAIIYIVTKKKLKANENKTLRLCKRKSMPLTPLGNNDQHITVANNSSHATRYDKLRLLREVFSENKEFIVAPAFTLIPQLFSLPFFIASFSLVCQNLQGNYLRYLLIGSYFTTFIPQLISFFLYISPSSLYSEEWRTTSISQRIETLKQRLKTILFTGRRSNTHDQTN